MAGDKELLKENWEGKIPVLFCLSEDEQFIREDCEPLLLSIRRQSYFPAVLYEKVNKHFKKFLSPDCSLVNAWLEDQDGNKLRWHWPVGVLFDLQCLSYKSVQIPWIITVHYTNFPKDDLIAFQSQECIKSFFMSGIKEADFLKYQGQNINSMKPADVSSLFESMLKENFEKFWLVNQQLMGVPASYQTSGSYKHLPFKIHFCSNKTSQSLVTPFDSEGKSHTLFDLFKVAFSRRLNGDKSAVEESEVTKPIDVSAVETGTEDVTPLKEPDLSALSLDSNQEFSEKSNTETTVEIGKTEETIVKDDIKTVNGEEKIVKLIENLRFLIHGISPPLSMPLHWLYNHLTYPDNFVHICVADFV